MTSSNVPAVRRRTVLASGSLLGAAGAVSATAGLDPAASAAPAAHRVFQHGVASGDPLPGAVVLWTRVTPTRGATPGSGVGPRTTVAWEVATDAGFRRIVRSGSVVTTAARDHTVKLDATGLKPATWYFYRFKAAGQTSRVGRTRTAPALDAELEGLRLGFTSCANWQAGYFSAYRGLAKRDDLQLIVHLGDYFYEYGPGQYGNGRNDVDIRPHVPDHEVLSLADYRQRHAQYKTDPDLQALHAKYPWIITWDDHEVANDQWSGGAENHQPATEGDWGRRRARAHRAYDEWMPVRMNGTARLGDGDRLYRRFRFGQLAEISMLDLRSYRSEQVSSPGPDTGKVDDPSRTITGAEQMAWLRESLASTEVQWKIIGNPVMIAPVTFAALPQAVSTQLHDALGVVPTDGIPYNVDQWDGYTADRKTVFAQLADGQTRDVVFITGDIHSGWAADLPADTSLYPAVGDSLAVEFVGASVTSNNLKDITGTPPRTTSVAVETAIKAANRHIKYLDFDSHGFCVLDVTPERTQCDWYVIGDRATKGSPSTWSVSYQTLAGSNAVSDAAGPVTA
ncbi:alkaline phosphatase D family protein [Nocardioides sp. TRM66260-LWL]|uniref:alkaline phosphatase D family protein n=1 Tax=Nocardioides sp. TRM66260-LWL TaxID=2874478 RepID=UPI001CC6285F|nr:alkaline phosphatase D family protein [Nocardioides sp. TRM66260-LWL]MBZ5735006.1 alkaline phosphatase D family protein [Nocardioides sp. TRM66260-LWL]